MCNMQPDHQLLCIFSTASGKRPYCTRSGSGSLIPEVLALSRAIEGGKRVSPQTHQDQTSRWNQERRNKMKWVFREIFIFARQRTARFVEGKGIIYALSKHWAQAWRESACSRSQPGQAVLQIIYYCEKGHAFFSHIFELSLVSKVWIFKRETQNCVRHCSYLINGFADRLFLFRV